ncbi:MAG: hypothetical protein IKR69_00810 [Bacteroidales bacterium]|nr:hypothetical protein [Bacteroidales bacterium]
MKQSRVLGFIAGVFALMGVLWGVFPAEGVNVAGLNLRFPSYAGALKDASEVKVNVDSVIAGVNSRFRMENDTLAFYRRFLYENPDRIYLPGDDYTFFDDFFREAEGAVREGRTVRVMHYGDSQIELDRISSDLRQTLQERFGGSGTGLFPALSNVPSASVTKSASGAFVQYTMYGDSTTVRAGHNRYGPMAQVVTVSGGGSMSIRATTSKTARPLVKSFSSVAVLYGRASQNFSIKVSSDTLKPAVRTLSGESGTTWSVWTFPREVVRAGVRFTGSAELYGVATDSSAGIAVDNVPLRGCSGTIFTRISEPLMTESFDLLDTRLIILQFGGNYMPVIRNDRVIAEYCEKIAAQIQYFHRVAPKAKILFVGPSDMGKSYGGKIVTWPRLPQLVDALRVTALENDAAFWDIFSMMGGENSMVRWVKHNPPYAGSDYIHFTPAGAKVVGETLARSLMTCYDFYDLRKTVPPSRVKEAMKR